MLEPALPTTDGYMTKSDGETFARVLQYCNTNRQRIGHPPVEGLIRGTKGDVNYCVIANTIAYGNSLLVHVDGNGISVSEKAKDETIEVSSPRSGERVGREMIEPVTFPMPEWAVHFIEEFDGGCSTFSDALDDETY